MMHDEVQELLEDYVDERLDRNTRKGVDDHLSNCAECRELLEGVASVDLAGLTAPAWDPGTMRRIVRRSMLWTAVNVALLWLAGWLILSTLGFLVFQPLIVDRGGRAAAATVATADLAVMFNPGATIDDWEYDSGWFSRTTSVHTVRAVGTTREDLGTLTTRIGPLDFHDAGGGSVFPFIAEATGVFGDIESQLQQIGPDTVTTVELTYAGGLTLDEAELMADSPRDVRLLWVGFAVDSARDTFTGLGFDPGGTVGYATCDPSPLPPVISGTGGGGSGTVYARPPSIRTAHAETLRALDNLRSHGELLAALEVVGASVERVDTALATIRSDPTVTTLVLTGPTAEVRGFVADTSPSLGAVRGIDFMNWFTPICGR